MEPQVQLHRLIRGGQWRYGELHPQPEGRWVIWRTGIEQSASVRVEHHSLHGVVLVSLGKGDKGGRRTSERANNGRDMAYERSKGPL
jgi:hypothetical protein